MLRAVVADVNAARLVESSPFGVGRTQSGGSSGVNLGFLLEMYTARFLNYEASNVRERLEAYLWFGVIPNSHFRP